MQERKERLRMRSSGLPRCPAKPNMNECGTRETIADLRNSKWMDKAGCDYFLQFSLAVRKPTDSSDYFTAEADCLLPCYCMSFKAKYINN